MAFWPAFLAQPARVPVGNRPSLTIFYLLVGAFFLTFLPHVEQLPIWISVAVVLALIVRCLLEFYRLPLPSVAFCSVMAICLLVGILIQFNTMVGREAGTAFMAGLLAIKFFEIRGPRDMAVIIFSSFFVVMSALLYSQALELFIYCLIMMWVLTALLMRVQIGDQPDDHLLRMLRLSGIIVLQALPLAIFLFFFFPRFTGKLQMTLNDSSLGLSDTVRPGSIARLAKDDSEAFYAKLSQGNIPTIDSMYWRAMILWNYHAGTWTPGKIAEVPIQPPLPAPYSDMIEQTITIDPHFKRWLFALDSPVSWAENRTEEKNWSNVATGDVIQVADHRSQVDHKEQYIVHSASALAPQDALGENEKRAALQLPSSDANDAIDADTVTLAKQLRQDHPDDESYISAVLHYFRHEGFSYSATPGAEGEDWLPVFLFKTKIGFCEHFASAFAVLMRLGNLPARVVIGYQGAQFNPYDGTYIVKQSNAHAWDEVWVAAKKHWIRVDPTAILSPGEDALPGVANAQPNQDAPDLSIQIAHHQVTLLSGTALPAWLRHAMVEVQLRRQQMEASWDDWVFSYDPDTQSKLADALGFGKNPYFWLVLACVAASGICVAIFLNWMNRKPPPHPVEHLYALFCRNMAQRGIPRAMWEGPMAYTGRLAEAFPEKEKAIRDVGSIVARTRYGASPADPSVPKTLGRL